MKFTAEVSNKDGEKLPGSLFLRGGSVAILLILQPEDVSDNSEEYVILTMQPRIPVGSLEFVEIPAGMLDDTGTLTGAAAREIKEETRLKIHDEELIDMKKLAQRKIKRAVAWRSCKMPCIPVVQEATRSSIFLCQGRSLQGIRSSE